MPESDDLYKILGVDPGASQQQISQAYRAKALAYHPDRVPASATEEVRRLAEDHMSVVNRAHGVLGDPTKRQAYDLEWLQSNSPPNPIVEPSSIRLENLSAGESRRVSFVIQNTGGPYTKIWFSEPEDSWATILSWSSLESDDELPLRVEIEAKGNEWGKLYKEIIVVRLDDVEATFKIELGTIPPPAPDLSSSFTESRSQGSSIAPTVGISSRPLSTGAKSKKIRNLILLHLAFIVAAGGSSLQIFWIVSGFVDTMQLFIVGALVPGVAMVIADFIWSVRKNEPNGQVEAQWLWLCLLAPFVGFIVLIIALVFYIRGLTTLLND